MKAAKYFSDILIDKKILKDVRSIKCDFYGSLGLTGKGHGSDKAFILGVQGYSPVTIDSDLIQSYLDKVEKEKALSIDNKKIPFVLKKDLKFQRRVSLPEHPNAMAIAAFDKDGKEILRKIYFSIGGGFILDEIAIKDNNKLFNNDIQVKYPFKSAKELLEICKKENKKISEIMYENERSYFTDEEIDHNLNAILDTMQKCIKRGFKNDGILPGGLKVKRRAPALYQKLSSSVAQALSDNLSVLDWVNLYALAVNEENAAGGQVVTAPTNGAAGIIPSILEYYKNFTSKHTENGCRQLLLTASAIGYLYKINASISGAEVGCQGEVGVACSMAAGALCEVLGGSVEQVANAAEIAMEHNLGLTCDPIGGLVQIPCIERNAMGAVKAINAARIALRGDGNHYVSLDQVINTMKRTGQDMKKQYKETSKGGLAVNIIEC